MLYNIKSISDGLTRHINETKNKEKDSNSSDVSLFTSALIQLPSSRERHAQIGVMLVTKFGRTLGATVVVFCQLGTILQANKLGP